MGNYTQHTNQNTPTRRTVKGNPRYATTRTVQSHPSSYSYQTKTRQKSTPQRRVSSRPHTVRAKKNTTTKKLLLSLLIFVILALIFVSFIKPNSSQTNASSQNEGQGMSDTQNSLPVSNEREYTPKADLGERANDLQLDPSRNTGWRLETDGTKKIYLTFDDGPSENTEKILKILEENNVKATFFVTGHSPDKFNLIKKEYEAGHSVGMHSYSHNYSEIYQSVDAYKADLDKIADVIKEQIGFTPFLFRFPGGSSNETSSKYCQGIMDELAVQLVNEGYQYYDWNMSSGDAGGDDIPAQTLVENSCQDGWTNITLLMHDTDAKTTTTEALPQIIKYYKDLGYEFCAITRDSFAVHHKISN